MSRKKKVDIEKWARLITERNVRRGLTFVSKTQKGRKSQTK